MRFYSGFSFRFRKKHLKWLIIPILAILAKFGLFTTIPKTYALVNNDTTYEITMPNYEELLNFQCGNYNFKEEFDNLVQNTDFSSLSFDIALMSQLNSNTGITSLVNIYVFQKNYRFQNFSVYYVQDNGLNFIQRNLPYYSDMKVYSLSFDSYSCTDLDSNSNWQNLVNAINTNTFSTNSTSTEFPFYSRYNATGITNSTNYSFTYWYYYSSTPLYYRYGSNASTSASNVFFKKLHLVDNDSYYTINNGANDGPLPSYTDIYGFSSGGDSSDNNYFLGYKNRLNVLYSNFLPSEINRFNINIKFDTNINNISAYDYYQNIDFTNINCYGRVNHNDNYYTYEKFPSCTFELNTDDLDISSDNDLVEFNIQNLEIFDSNDNKITNFSNYDKLFYYISFQYEDNTFDLSVRNLEFTSLSNLLYSDILRGEIFDNFSELPIYSKFLFSNTGFSNSLSSNISARTKKDLFNNSVFLYAQKYNLSTLEVQDVYSYVASDSFQNLKVDNANNLGYMIYNKTDNLNSVGANINLDLVLMRDIVVSFNNVASNDFYYSDSTGNIINNDIEINYSNGLTTDLNDLGGLLPPGPLDSLLNIPFYYTDKVITSLNQTCEPWTFNFVFNKPFTMPCFDTFYEEFPPSVVVFLEVIPCAFLLIAYFKHLYKKVDRATSLNTSSDDEWGVL